MQTAQPVNPNQSVITEQVWYVKKKITNVTDEFRLSEDFGNGNTLTLGAYAAITRTTISGR